jgi:NitT/TauT family transport system permease protein
MKKHLYTISTFLAVILLWYFASLNANPLFIPSPLEVIEDFKIFIGDRTLFIHLWYTFRRIMTATLLAGGISIPLGLLVRNSKIAKATIYPVISLLRYVPVTAFYPLLIMWAGIEEEMKISFLFIACFVYMLPSVVLSLEEVSDQLIDTGRTIGMSKLQIITRIQLPSTLPSILHGFVMMVGIGWTYCAVVETINAKYGLGYIIHQSSSRGNTSLVFMSIITIMVVSFVFDNVCKIIIRKVFRWKYLKEE